MKNILRFLLAFLAFLILNGCHNFLDMKPDQKMAIPKTLEHADLLLNDYSILNAGFPTYGEIASDDYFISTENWNGLYDMDEKATYNWTDDDISNATQWQNSYRTIYQVNLVLNVLQELDANKNKAQFDRVKGGAYFFRAFALHQLATVFTLAYNEKTAANDLGLPLRLIPEIDYKSTRSSLKDTYNQIITDYKMAIRSLPKVESLKGRPSRAAAYGGLARLYLDMGDYQNAFVYADSSWMINEHIVDYNSININASTPFQRFNPEVLFAASTPVAGPLGMSFCLIDTALYASYSINDLRKTAFFRKNIENSLYYSFKGSYDGSNAGLFVGLTTPELLLIRAEAAVRTNKISQALSDYNKLLKNRIRSVSYVPSLENNPDRLLPLILEQRRKELIFRGRRWADLKRLNKEPRFAKQLVRVLDGETYSLQPNSLKYAIKIPQIVIEQSGITQNIR